MTLQDFVPDDAIRCALVGPSRIGKTSLITAVIDDAQRMVEGRPVRIVPADGPTLESVNASRDTMRGAIDARGFNPGALGSTGSVQIFNIALDPGGKARSRRVHISMADYPGDWLTRPTLIPPEKQADWEFCSAFIAESTVLLVPIDATILMEATTPAELAARRASWPSAWSRPWCGSGRPSGPRSGAATSPRSSSSARSSASPTSTTTEAATIARSSCSAGCGSLRRGPGHRPGRVERPRPAGPLLPPRHVRLCRAGAGGVATGVHRSLPGPTRRQAEPTRRGAGLQLFCQLLVEAEADLERAALAVPQEQIRRANQELSRPRGFFSRLLFKWSGDMERVQQARARSEADADELERRLAELEVMIKDLASRDIGPRVSSL